MMKDPTYTEDWVDALALRIRQLERISFRAASEIPSVLSTDPYDPATAEAIMPPNCKITRSSAVSLAGLRTLPAAANILLFTPVLNPAGRVLGKPNGNTMDPFEAFGRALSQHHKRVRHVPYVPKVGFTETHETFISQADAVVTVVCEPERGKYESMTNQMDFAEQTLDALESKEASASHALILVQCGDDQYRLPVDASFMNVIESTTYNAEYARHIARAIFTARV